MFECIQTYSVKMLLGRLEFIPVLERLPVPVYAIDDETAIKVKDGKVEVVSEGHWKLFTP